MAVPEPPLGNRSAPANVAEEGGDPTDPSGGSARAPTWEDVAREHGRFLYSVAYRLTGDHDDASDLVQEVLLRVRKGLEGFRPGSMEAWLSRIATNAFLDDVRRRRRRPVQLVDDPAKVAEPFAPEPADAAAQMRLPDDVQEAVRSLPPEFRAAVVLSDVVGLSYGEIADALDVPVGTVRSRIHRGRMLLRRLLVGAEVAS